MNKINKHIQIMRTQLPGLSSLSRESALAIQVVLGRHYETVRITNINTIGDLQQLVLDQPDLVFAGIKYITNESSERIWIADYLDQHGIAHTGSSKRAIQFESSKQLAKRCIQKAGLKTAAFKVIKEGKVPSNVGFDFPVFVKPTDLGGGAGIDDASVVHNHVQLHAKVMSLKGDSLVEQYLTGREFSVAIIADQTTRQLTAYSIELVAPPNLNGDRMLCKQVKTADTEMRMVIENPVERERVNNLALKAFNALGARDYGRIDIRMDAEGVPHFLEANLIPSLIDNYGSFPKACMLNADFTHEDMILKIVQLGLLRSVRRESFVTSSVV